MSDQSLRELERAAQRAGHKFILIASCTDCPHAQYKRHLGYPNRRNIYCTVRDKLVGTVNHKKGNNQLGRSHPLPLPNWCPL